MSAETGQLAAAAEDAVLAARRARAGGDPETAAVHAQVAIQHYLDCAGVADDRRIEDANDLARAGAAAAAATDFLAPGQRGLRPLSPLPARGAWRQPGSRQQASSGVAGALAMLDRIDEKARAHKATRR